MSLVKRNVLVFLQKHVTKPVTKTSIRTQMKIPNSNRKSFSDALRELEREGLVVVTKKKRISAKKGLQIIIGRFYSNSRGYGFVVNSEQRKAVFIPNEQIGEAFHEDLVIAVITAHPEGSKNPEGKIVSILKREIDTIVGTYMDSEQYGFVVPDDSHYQKDIYIPKDKALNANSYDKVVCKIHKYPKRDRKPEGEIVEVIGVRFEKGVDLLSILKEKRIPQEFPAKVLREADQIAELASTEELSKRLDLRHEVIFTIDGEDAKDLDDAISIERLPNDNFKLGVHIADVAHYVKEQGKIDQEALERGTSVYLVDTVIPMLPKKLSNHLCSLNANEDKLALSVIMEINAMGNVIRQSFHESVIRSSARLNYTEVSNYLEGADPGFANRHPLVLEKATQMKALADILREKRVQRGAIEFDFAESKIKLDAQGNVVDVQKYERRIAHGMIEECMLICNETVAEFFMKKAIPFVYRIHDKPREERMEDFRKFIMHYGYSLSEPDVMTTKELQDLLQQVKATPEHQAVNFLLLRSMMQAKYSPVCKGHFGLSASYYSHFTSPIRRYPDLQIHRIIKEYLNGGLSVERKNELEKIVENTSMVTSKRERVADQAEEEYKLLKKLEFMSDKLGETYEATIVNMNNTSLSLALDNTVEGKIYANALKQPYVFEEEFYQWVSGDHSIRLGDTVVVKVKGVHLERKEIEFDLVAL